LREFQLFIIETHQFFFALVVLVFSVLLIQDLKEIKEKLSLEKRTFLSFILLLITGGVFWVLFESWGMEGIFFALEFSILVTISLLHPKFAVSFLVYLLLSRPWETYGNQMMSSMPRDVSILAMISILVHKFFKKQFYFRFNLGTVLLLAFSFWLFLSAMNSNNVDGAMLEYSEVFSKGVILFLMIQNGLEVDKDLVPVKAVFALAILEKCFVSFYKTYGTEAPTIVESTSTRLESVGILSNSNDIAAIFVLAIPFTIYFILKTKLRPFHWIFAAGILAVMVLLVWSSQSRGALLGIFAIFGAFSMIKVKSKKLLSILVAFGLIGTIGAFSLLSRDAGDIEGSTNNRMLYWRAGVNMAIRNPIFGVGYGGFPKSLPSYVPDGNLGSEGEHMTAHSSWVLALGESGPLGLLLFISLWAYGALAAWKIRLSQPEYFMAIAGYGIAISFLSHTYLLYPYILLSLAITHYHILGTDKFRSEGI
jgi:hypothetical protein